MMVKEENESKLYLRNMDMWRPKRDIFETSPVLFELALMTETNGDDWKVMHYSSDVNWENWQWQLDQRQQKSDT